MNSERRLLAVLGDVRSIPKLLSQANFVVTAMRTNAALFPAANPPIDILAADVTALVLANNAIRTRTGTVPDRNARSKKLRADLDTEVAYVQTQADASAALAATIIAAAGLRARAESSRSKPPLQVTQPRHSGSVDINAKAGPKGKKLVYEYGYSVDGMKTWISLPPVPTSKTTVDGLTVAVMHAFRYRITSTKGPGDWSDPVMLLVR